MFHLPFVFAVYYRLKGQPTSQYLNNPCKVVLARTGIEAIRKFNKRHRKYEALFAIKL